MNLEEALVQDADLKPSLTGIHEGHAIYLFYNSISTNKSVAGHHILTGPKVIDAVASRMGGRAAPEFILFRHTTCAPAL